MSLPVGPELDRHVWFELRRLFPVRGRHGWRQRWPAPRAWSTDYAECGVLIAQIARGFFMGVQWGIDLRFWPDGVGGSDYASESFLDRKLWQCILSSHFPSMNWEASGEGRTMPEAFCRALLHTQERYD